ncbi:MAG TPA: hypothetical protein VH025_11445 [Solirubrobacteraceae bacterium]|jgi:hypothetical protein|nr:hypothetical protein [Solirubrobacteraceae bacterium]
MNRKFLAAIAPVLACTALAVAPALAQAEPHWYKGKVLLGSTPMTVTTSGNLTINALGATIKCKVNDAEEVWNPSGGPGVDLMAAFTLTNCKNKVATAACPKGAIAVTAEGFSWPSRLFTEAPTTIRDEINKVRLNVGCAGTSGTVGDVFEGTLTPEVGKGKLAFGGAGGGTLVDAGLNPLTVSGNDKFASPKGILAKDP